MTIVWVNWCTTIQQNMFALTATWHHAHDSFYQAFPLRFCILQAIKNWRREWLGNKDIETKHFSVLDCVEGCCRAELGQSSYEPVAYLCTASRVYKLLTVFMHLCVSPVQLMSTMGILHPKKHLCHGSWKLWPLKAKIFTWDIIFEWILGIHALMVLYSLNIYALGVATTVGREIFMFTRKLLWC